LNAPVWESKCGNEPSDCSGISKYGFETGRELIPNKSAAEPGVVNRIDAVMPTSKNEKNIIGRKLALIL
jgi:hypothetical protein